MKKGTLQGPAAFGGTLLKNSNAKTARPLRGRAHLHVVLQVKDRRFALTKKANLLQIRQVAKKLARKNKLRLRALHCDQRHIHFNIYVTRKKGFKPFIRALCGSLALKLSGASKLKALKEKFWACRPWTCVESDSFNLITPGKELSRALIKHLHHINMREARHGPLRRLALGP